MKMRQQQDSSYITKINKQKALCMQNNNNGSNINQNEASIKGGLITMASSNYGVDYERDESPVSVISHSASVISQPSSACTSMEHHLMLNPNLINPKLISPQKFATSNYAYNQEQFSMGTSAASTSEDDSSAYNLPTLFFEGATNLQEELSEAGATKVIFRESSCEEELGTQQNFKKLINNKSLINSGATVVADSLNSDDDDQHMISIDLQGLQENPLVLREKFLKGNGNKLAKEEEKQAINKFSAKLKQYDEWKKDQKPQRNTSNGQAALVGKPHYEPASKIANFSANYTRDRATTHVGIYEGGPQSAQRNAIEKGPPNLASRQKSINSTKAVVSSKWDDAEKWLCYDNHVSHHHKAKNSPISGQKLHSSNATLDVGNLSVSKANNECKDNHASGSPSVNKAYECKDNHGLKDDVACSTVANHLMMQNINTIPSRGTQSIDVMSRGKHAFASQSSNSNGLLRSKMLEDDNLKRKWFGTSAGACGNGDFDYMSSGEIVNPHVLSNKLAAISVSDGEIHTNNTSNYQHYHASQMSISSGSPSGGESKKKDNFKTTFERWKKDNDDESVVQHRIRECDYLSSGELVRQANNHQKLAAICASDGEMYSNYASDQQNKSNASYTQRFKQHHILQRLRRKCIPGNGGLKGAAQHVREDGAQNLVVKNSNGSVHAASRLSNISMQASLKKDQFCTQGEYSRTLSVGRLEKEDAGEESVCINAGMQREFVVQTPTHGRSASMKDACTEVSPSLSRRDMGTQMTPSESSPVTSKCTSPMQSTSPARHNTPTRTSPTLNPQMNNIDITRDDEDEINSSEGRGSQYNNGNALELESCNWAKLEHRGLPSGGQTTSEKNSDLGPAYNDRSPAICLEEEIVGDEQDHENDAVDVDEMHSSGIMKRLSVLDARAAAWEEAERAKFHANRYKREEARINAWETLQKVKAEAELKKLEVKLERLRSRATEKVLSKVAAAEKRAEEMRATAEAQQLEQMRKVRERACNLRKTALFPGSFAVCFARNYMP